MGQDTTPVDYGDYQVPFRFTGKPNRLTLKVEQRKLTPEEEQLLLQEGQRNKKAGE